MIFQDPLTSLHPFYKVGKQMVEAIQVHRKASDKEARDRAIELLTLSGSRTRSGASTSIRTSSRAGCGSGR